MKFSDIKAITRGMFEAGESCEREYRLSDRVSVTVDLLIIAKDELQVHLSPRPARPLAAPDPDYLGWHPPIIGMADLTAAELSKLAEIKAMVDAWKDGRSDTLPPSTSTVLRENAAKLAAEEAKRHRDLRPW